MISVYVNGCSMVFGKDLVKMTPEEEDLPSLNLVAHLKRLRKAWPAQMCARLRELAPGKEFRDSNAGECGSSPQSIFRRTLQDMGRGADDFALIGLTEPQRFEYNEDGGWKQVVLPRDSVKYLPRRVRRFADDVAWYMHQDVPSYEMYAAYTLALQQFFVARGIPYAFVNSLDTTYLTMAMEANPSINLQFDWSCVVPDSMYAMCVRENVPFGSTIHPLERGHQLWGNHVAEHLAKRHPTLVG